VKRILHTFFIFGALVAAAPLWGQTKMYGINVGAGSTDIVRQNEEAIFVSPLNRDNEDFLQVGLDYQYAPGNSSIFFKSGLMYNARTTDNTALDYLRAPFGIDIGIGNTFQFIFGANVFTGFLLAHSGFEDNRDFNDNMRRFQFGWGGNLGFGLDLSKRVNLNLMYQRNFELTEMYSVSPSVGKGNDEAYNLTGQDGFVRMGLNYKILTP